MERRDFVRTCGIACISGSSLAAILQGCVSPYYIAESSSSGNQLQIKKSEFSTTSNGKIIQRKYVLVKSEKFNFPIYVYKISEAEYCALLLECTHKGCELKPQGDHLLCPCHGSEFSHTGKVESPPAEEDLKKFELKTDNESVYIQV
jgi:cytochrome b6-f complex iron-sulfur subunit